MSANKTFWNDLARDLKDPEFLREYIVKSMRIATVDAIVNELDDGTRQCNARVYFFAATALWPVGVILPVCLVPGMILRKFNGSS